jgi:hypothetical protein
MRCGPQVASPRDHQQRLSLDRPFATCRSASNVVQSVTRGGAQLPARGGTVLAAGDEVELILDVIDVESLDRLFGDGR